jgi:hypothetical protein
MIIVRIVNTLQITKTILARLAIDTLSELIFIIITKNYIINIINLRNEYTYAVAQPGFLDQWANFYCAEKTQWAKWATFLLMGKKFLVQQNIDNVGKIQENEMMLF